MSFLPQALFPARLKEGMRGWRNLAVAGNNREDAWMERKEVNGQMTQKHIPTPLHLCCCWECSIDYAVCVWLCFRVTCSTVDKVQTVVFIL